MKNYFTSKLSKSVLVFLLVASFSPFSKLFSQETFGTAQTITSGNAFTSNLTNSTVNDYSTTYSCLTTGGDLVYTFTLATSSVVNVQSTQTGTKQVNIALLKGQTTSDCITNTNASTTTINLIQQTLCPGTYYIIVEHIGSGNYPITTTMTATVFAPGSIIGTQSIASGGVPTLFNSSGSATNGVPTITYQWYKKTGVGGSYAPISGATGLTYQEGALADGTYFYLRSATDACPTTVSTNEIQLTVGSGVLATELTKFDAQLHGKTTVLSWESVNEENIDNYTIERSKNGKDYIPIGRVAGGNINGSYTFTDDNPNILNYYRLRIIDNDGSFTYSKVLTVASSNTTKNIKVYPNPVGIEGYLNIETPANVENIFISNSLGQVVLTSNVSKINISQLTKGVYFVTVKTSEKAMTEKFYKQ